MRRDVWNHLVDSSIVLTHIFREYTHCCCCCCCWWCCSWRYNDVDRDHTARVMSYHHRQTVVQSPLQNYRWIIRRPTAGTNERLLTITNRQQRNVSICVCLSRIEQSPAGWTKRTAAVTAEYCYAVICRITCSNNANHHYYEWMITKSNWTSNSTTSSYSGWHRKTPSVCHGLACNFRLRMRNQSYIFDVHVDYTTCIW